MLLNFYCDGTAKIGAHRDSETDMDASVPIAALGVDATRNIIFKRPKCEDISYELNHCFMITMS